MYFITFLGTLLSGLLLITPAPAIRTSSSPKYLFSSESNNLDEGTFVASQDLSESLDHESLGEEEIKDEYYPHSRSRRAAAESPPVVKASQELCEHEQLIIRWTEGDTYTSIGSIIALCRKGTDENAKPRPSLVFVSYDHGLIWNNVTDKFIDAAGIEDYYIVKEKPNFIIFPDKANKRIFYTNDGLKTVQVASGLPFKPEEISINPSNPSLVIASNGKNIYLSKDGSKTYNLVKHFNEINAYYWGSKIHGDKETDIFAEGKVSGGQTQGYKVDCSGSSCAKPQALTDQAPLNGVITDFMVKNEYMFCTKERADKNGVDFFVKYQRSGVFVKAKIQTKNPLRELFVYDVSDNMVMVVVNHQKNETNLYISLNQTGIEYSLSLPRVLYHNPHTDVSSHWLRRAVAYRFVDVRRVKGLPSVYFATQLTVGPVGGRYLISVMTFDKGGVWQRIRGPPRNKYDQMCYYPTCSLHVNLFYGSIYRYSRTTPLMSRESAPGLIMTTGVLGANLKITPDTYISRDGGKSFELVLNGKRRFAFGDHGGFVVASHFLQSRYLQYSFDFKKFQNVQLLASDVIQIKKILTEPGQRGVVYIVAGTVKNKWRLFQVNATKTLGRICTKDDYNVVNVTDVGVGGCVIKQVQQRNASTRCLTGKSYKRITQISYEKCSCRRPDYRCDYKFEPTIVGGCRKMAGVTFVPQNCPEGSFYNQPRGYVKIQGHNCIEDNVTRDNFSPMKTPCPAAKLTGLAIKTTPAKRNGVVPVALNEKVVFSAILSNAYLPHVNFTWKLMGAADYSGIGNKFSNFSHVMPTAGTTLVSLSISNSRNSLFTVVTVVVERRIDPATIIIRYIPTLPSVLEKVSFLAFFSTGTKTNELGHLMFKWLVGSTHSIETNSPFYSTTFNTSGRRAISVSVRNMVSDGRKSIHFLVTNDLKVKNVQLSNVDGFILVKWDLVVEPLFTVLGYRVKYRKEKDAYFVEANCKIVVYSCLISNVTAYTKYQVKVEAVAPNGYGPQSDVLTIQTLASLPGVPVKVKLVTESRTSVEASWQPPKLLNGVITGYSYKFYLQVTGANVSAKVSKQLTIKINDLLANKYYHFEVAAINQIGIGRYSEVISAITGQDKPTLPPTNVHVWAINKTTAKIAWSPPKIKASQIFFSPKGYHIYSVDPHGLKRLIETTSEIQFTFKDLQPNTQYTYLIAAYVSGSVGPAAKITFTTLSTPPSSPTNFKKLRQSSRSVTLSWTPPQTKNGLKLSYEVYQLSPGTEKLLVTTSETQATVKQLKPDKAYVFAVKTVKEDLVKSSYSNNVSVKTDQDTPEAPTNVEVTDRWPSSSSVRVSWQLPASSNGVITKYRVMWHVSGNTDDVYEKIVSVTSATFLDIDHLKQETKYRFEVVAFTKVGAGGASFVFFTTRFYPFGSEHLIIQFQVAKTAKKLAGTKTLQETFISILQRQTNIPKKRFADVRLNTTSNSVEFELISNEKNRESSNEILSEMDHIKTLLAPSFDASGNRDFTKRNSVRSVETYTGAPSASKSSSSSTNITVIVTVVCAGSAIILILIVALVVLFRRYRENRLYNQFDNQVQYNNENLSPNVDGEVEIRSPSYKYRNKDIETVPLADADELT